MAQKKALHPRFDQPPEVNRFGVAMRWLVGILALATIPAGNLYGNAAAAWTGFAAFVVFLAGRLARELTAILLHTAYRLLELWVGVMVCGAAVGGLVSATDGLARDQLGPDERMYAWIGCACIVLIALWFLLRGLYCGLRLAMWLKAEGTAQRLGLLVLGFLSPFAPFLILCCLATSWGFFLGAAATHPPSPSMEWTAYLLSGSALVLFIAAIAHHQFAKRAQKNFEADPEALGKAGRLVPEGGRCESQYLVHDLVAFVRRLLGGGRGSGSGGGGEGE